VSVLVPGLDAHLRGWLSPVDLFGQATGYDINNTPWLIEYLDEQKDAIVLKGRQVAASTGAGVLAIRLARYVPWSLCGIISPGLRQSTEVKERAKSGLLRLGDHLVKDNSSEIALRNHSRVISLPGSAKSARGWSFDFLVIDEAAFLDQETFLAVRATVATGGRTIVQSTPEGPFGHFYDLWMEDDPARAKFRVRSDEVKTISAEFLAGERATMTAEEYSQEYEAEFTTPGLGLIDPERLKELTEEAQKSGEPTVWDMLRGAQ
jgi:hypothetical protein